MRLVLHLLRREASDVVAFAHALQELVDKVQRCRVCHNISDNELCPICSDSHRDHSIVCVVEDVQDVIAFEATQQFNGIYHVLGGIISPIEGIGPQDLEIDSLVKRLQEEHIAEVILALSPTMEGDTTCYYIYRRIQALQDTITLPTITTLARGVAQNDQLQYTDEFTLGRSLLERRPFR